MEFCYYYIISIQLFVVIGSADWFIGRRFSLTSSQAHYSFLAALPEYMNEEEWIALATYLLGPNWAVILKLIPTENTTASDTTTTTASEDATTSEDATASDTATNVTTPTTPTLQDYVQSLLENSPQSYSHELINDMKLLILPSDNDDDEHGEDQTESDDDILDDLRNGKSQSYKSEFLNVLSQRIPESHRDPRQLPKTDTALTKKFLEFINAKPEEREFHFYKKEKLLHLAREKGIKGVSASSINSLITALGGFHGFQGEREVTETNQHPLSANQKVIQTILKHSFMPHQKGKLREYCSRGHQLELPILIKWIAETKKISFPSHICIKQAFTAGLVEKKNCPWAKDSVDFLMLVEDDLFQDDEVEVWGVEIKSRVTVNTATEEEDHMMNLDRPKHVEINYDQVHDYLPRDCERYQILHHAYVYDLHKVVLIVGDDHSEIIQSTIVKFPREIRDQYGYVLAKVKDMGLYWVYNDTSNIDEIPEEVLSIADDLKCLNGREALLSAFYLWKRIMSMSLPLPVLLRIIPIYCAYWNQVKSLSDTSTLFMEECKIVVPTVYTNASTIAASRIIQLLFVTVHRLCHIVSSKDTNDNYGTLERYRNAASKRSSFPQRLAMMKDYFERQIENLSKNNTSTTATVTPLTQTRRQNPSRILINNTAPSLANHVPKVTGKTPEKMTQMKRKLENGQVEPEVEKRWKNCKGFPMKIHKFDTTGNKQRHRQSCSDCGRATSWYCTQCKGWFCVET